MRPPLEVEGDSDRSSELLPMWIHVVYGWGPAVNHAQRVLDGIAFKDGVLARILELGDDPTDFVRDQLTVLAGSLKHGAFAAEEEARFLVTTPHGSLVRYRPTGRGILPYVELVLRSDARQASPLASSTGQPREPLLAIRAVIVGPHADTADRRLAALESYKLSRQLPISVATSGIPFVRQWRPVIQRLRLSACRGAL